ncbi:hypothetical protein [Plantibacter sp. YIM 135249]|uniref:hypothetical protein n=1 Tax=Plantibacter sp. YIM 135249 TaxID=3423918 RepID=UPI003D338847
MTDMNTTPTTKAPSSRKKVAILAGALALLVVGGSVGGALVTQNSTLHDNIARVNPTMAADRGDLKVTGQSFDVAFSGTPGETVSSLLKVENTSTKKATFNVYALLSDESHPGEFERVWDLLRVTLQDTATSTFSVEAPLSNMDRNVTYTLEPGAVMQMNVTIRPNDSDPAYQELVEHAKDTSIAVQVAFDLAFDSIYS